MPKYDQKTPKQFDFSTHPVKHVVFRIAYHGQTHDGLARQQNTANTIEHIFIAALIRVRLIPPVPGTTPEQLAAATTAEEASALLPTAEKFSRCGRTDKGVSALGNAISLMVRASKDTAAPIDYARTLNRVLPNTVRVIAWSFVPPEFDARFSCKSRTYRYFFPTRGLKLDRIRKAAELLCGEHDFRNFCKMDIVNVSNFVREIFVAEIHEVCRLTDVGRNPSPGTETENDTIGVAFLEVRGNAFLYHQIRCMVAVLLMVGAGEEEPGIITKLLDVTSLPSKPCYTMASDAYLVLWDCEFDEAEVAWKTDAVALRQIRTELATMTDQCLLRAVMCQYMDCAVGCTFGGTPQVEPTTAAMCSGGMPPPPTATAKHIPLLQRPREHSYEMKVESLSETKKRRREGNIKLQGERGQTKDETS